MDFKVAGTRNGVTALQMDIKITGINWDVFRTALAQAHQGRNHILDIMEAVISKPSETLSPYAPQIIAIHIDPEKIGKVIGPGGKTIRAIQDETETRISIDDDGTVQIASNNGENAALARTRIEELTASAEEGQVYTGTVVRVVDFGAFVEILPGTDGLVHISQIADHHVPSIHDVVKVGDEIMVMVTNIGSDGKIRLSRQAVLEGWTLEEAQSKDRGGGGGRKSGGRGRGGDRRR
jgi:polyribonucleotide nucleotidyltransferase